MLRCESNSSSTMAASTVERMRDDGDMCDRVWLGIGGLQ